MEQKGSVMRKATDQDGFHRRCASDQDTTSLAELTDSHKKDKLLVERGPADAEGACMDA